MWFVSERSWSTCVTRSERTWSTFALRPEPSSSMCPLRSAISPLVAGAFGSSIRVSKGDIADLKGHMDELGSFKIGDIAFGSWRVWIFHTGLLTLYDKCAHSTQRDRGPQPRRTARRPL